MKKIIFLLALLLAFAYAMLLPACHKDPPDPPAPPPVVLPDTLPPLTTTGANTFGCYVNGKLWLPKADWKAYADPSFAMISSFFKEGESTTAGYLSVETSTDSARQSITLGWPGNAKSLGIFHTNRHEINDFNAFDLWFYDAISKKAYYPDDRGVNLMNHLAVIYLDTVTNIISGNFEAKLYRGNGHKITNWTDSIVITNGRFDIRYSQ